MHGLRRVVAGQEKLNQGEHEMTLPRGIRNRNAGNIERSQQFEWHGEVRPDPKNPRYDDRFCVFDDSVMGLRAMMKNLITYNQRRGVKTLREAIAKWAPSFENNVDSYVNAVARHADISPDDEWDFTQRIFLVPVVRGMVLHENGQPTAEQMDSGVHKYWYTNKIYDDAYEMAVNGRVTSHTRNELPVKKVEIPEPKLSLWQRILKIFKGE